jgi:hypothetical protein
VTRGENGRQSLKQDCSCPCGATRFAVEGDPIGRFLCHCTICQAVYRKPFADATYFWGRSIALPDKHAIEFRRYRPPPALNRGICPHCRNPAVAFMGSGALKVGFVPSRKLSESSRSAGAGPPYFYDRRVADVDDSIPKISGYWSSEAYVTRTILGAVFRSRGNA